MAVRPAKTEISLGIRPVWSESSLCAQWVAKDLSVLHADSKDSDQTGQMPRQIWVFAGRTLVLLVLSCRSSYCFQRSVTKGRKRYLIVFLHNVAYFYFITSLSFDARGEKRLSICAYRLCRPLATFWHAYWPPNVKFTPIKSYLLSLP